VTLANLEAFGFEHDVQISAAPRRWRPQVKAGYFWGRDREHYLYARKHTTRLKYMEVREYALPGPMDLDLEIGVRVDGVAHDDWWIEGDRLFIHQTVDADKASFWANVTSSDEYGLFLSGVDWSDEVSIEVTGTRITSPNTGLDRIGHTGVYQLPDATGIQYKFPPDFPAVAGAPVVLTDDTIGYSDQRDFRVEFEADFETQYLKPNTARNRVRNPHFDEGLDHWLDYTYDTTDFIRGHVHTDPTGGFVGPDVLRLNETYPVTGAIYQQFDYSSGRVGTLSARFRADAAQPATGTLEVVYIDHTGSYLDTEGNVIGVDPEVTLSTWGVDTIVTGSTWQEVSLQIGAGDGNLDPTGIAIPSSLARIEVRLRGTAVRWDAVRFAEGFRSQYDHVSREATVEYETSAKGFYHYDPTAADTFPFEQLNNISLDGVTGQAVNGFLALQEFSNVEDRGLGLGGPSSPTGVVESPVGIMPPVSILGGDGAELVQFGFGRRYLPYAQVNGTQKLAQVGKNHINNLDFGAEIVTSPQPPLIPAFFSIDGYGSSAFRGPAGNTILNITRDGTGDLAAQLLDADGNPIIHERVTAVATTGTISVSAAYTDQAGIAYFEYLPAGATNNGDEVTFRHETTGLQETLQIDFV
jgi:hypothetical protein